MASRQACVGGRPDGTEKAPSAMHWSPPAWPITAAGTPAAAAAPSTAATCSAATATTTRDVDSPNAASAAVHDRAPGAVSEVDPESGVAAERHLAQRDREPAVAHVVHAGDLALAHERRRRARAAATRRVEIGDRRRAAVETVHDRGPLRTAELGPGLAEHDDRLAGGEPRRRRAVASSSSIRPSTPTTGVGWMSAPLDAL